ncbi:sialate O-acetylesterase [Parabacteroides sp. Marseille-P3160]|uniref:sialate O-acetylesterase n=1 Tax=Parabacteroides sp. Marseille-P3160 TaxID=1917887 RepID=UPI0009BB481E|nr:sialate O-acetylesterase [Parabacteroides sp. Marseille-P3160]
MKHYCKYPSCFLFVFFLFLSSSFSNASIRFPSVIGDRMVLQRNSTVSLWGWANKGERISVQANWNPDESYSAVASSNGKWEVRVKTPEAGGPYELTFQSANDRKVIKDVLIGEVWVCSGQSNMEMPLKGFISQPVYESNDIIAQSNNPQIRLFTVKRNISETPLEDCEGAWILSEPKEVANFSAVAYIYGAYLYKILNVPIGLIHASWGGTPAEAWTDKEILERSFKDIPIQLIEKSKHRSPAVLYNAMLHPLIPYGIRGVIWYQGEGNRMNPTQYERLFPAMVTNWRQKWGIGEFPFYFVQIAPYRYDSDKNSAELREAQLKTMLSVPNTGMAVTLDVGEYSTIHPGNKVAVGKRLAYWALAKTYHIEGIEYSGPVYKSMKIEGGEAILDFSFAENGLTSLGKPLEGFSIAGSDKKFYPVKAIIKGKNVIVSSDSVPQPVAVRYGWDNYVEGYLYNNAGLPASSFRTDTW